MDKRRQMMAEALRDAVEWAERDDHIVRMSTEAAGQLIEMLGASGAAGSGYADRVAAQAPPLQEDGPRGMADREQVINSLAEGILFVESRGYGGTAQVMNEALELLKEQPKIVRCGECIRRASYDCPIYQGGDGMHDEPDDWFCGDGERRV